MISISPGHYGPKTGAHGLIDEVTEAIRVSKRVTEILRTASITTNYIEDNVSKSQSKNIPWLIAQHNKTSRAIDVSVHFNASTGTQSKGIGVETLIHNGKNLELAENITNAIAKVSGLKNRGVKIRTDLGILKGTNKPCYLIEVCFVNDSVDVALYKRDFEKICQAIASELAKGVGKSINKGVEGKDMEFVNDDLKRAYNTRKESKATKDLLINAAIKALDLNKKEYKDGDMVALAYELAVYFAKKNK